MATRRDILAQYLKTTPETLQFLGKGNFAEVYLYKGKAYKVTRDIDDYLLATRLIKEGKKFDCFIKVYKTKIFNIVDGNRKQELYLIISEKITPLLKADNDEVLDIWRTLTMNNDCKNYLVDGQPLYFPEYYEHNSLAKDLFKQMQDIFNVYKKLGMKCWDFYARNIAYMDGKIKLYDFGYSSLKEKNKYSKRHTVTFNIKSES